MPAPIVIPESPVQAFGLTSITFVADQPSLWSATKGTIIPTEPPLFGENVFGGFGNDNYTQNVTFYPVNETGEVVMTVITPDGSEIQIIINVRGEVPPFWEYNRPVTSDKVGVKVWRPVLGPTQVRVSGPTDLDVHEWDLGAEDSSYEEFVDFQSFHRYHYPGKPVDLVDPIRMERRTFTVDSPMTFKYNHSTSISWSFRLKEEYPFAVTIL